MNNKRDNLIFEAVYQSISAKLKSDGALEQVTKIMLEMNQT